MTVRCRVLLPVQADRRYRRGELVELDEAQGAELIEIGFVERAEEPAAGKQSPAPSEGPKGGPDPEASAAAGEPPADPSPDPDSTDAQRGGGADGDSKPSEESSPASSPDPEPHGGDDAAAIAAASTGKERDGRAASGETPGSPEPSAATPDPPAELAPIVAAIRQLAPDGKPTVKALRTQGVRATAAQRDAAWEWMQAQCLANGA